MSVQTIAKIIHDINASKGKRKGCQGLSHSLESDGYIPSIVNWVGVTTPERIDLLVKYISELQGKLDASVAAERVWETTMMQVCGEDGPASVAAEIKALRDLRDTALVTLRSENEELQRKVEVLVVENAVLKETLENVINPDNEPEYHDQGMGCGVEDHGYQRNGYAACSYGWESAMERIYSEVIPGSMPETPATDTAIAEIVSKAQESVINKMCIAFVKHRALVGLDDSDTVTVKEANGVILHCSEQLRKESATHEQ